MFRESPRARVIEGIGLLVGMIIGAGIFALPYSFSRSGFLWGSVFFILTLCVSWILHLLYAAVIYVTPGHHRITGYVRMYLGSKAEIIMFIFTLFAYYGSMLAYGILGAIFLQNIYGLDFFTGGLLFLVLGGVLFFFPLRLIGKINFYLVIPLLFFILALAWFLFPGVASDNFSSPEVPDWLLPYGVLIFAFGGYAVLPDLKDVLGNESRRSFKKIIFWGLLFVALLYLVFTVAVLGSSGRATTPDALSGLSDLAGGTAVVIGSFIGLLATFTSYIVFGADLKFIYRYDYNFPVSVAWLFAFVPPILLFASGFNELVKVLSLVGSVGLGVFGGFVLWISYRERGRIREFLGFVPRLWWLLPLGVLIILGAIQDVL